MIHLSFIHTKRTQTMHTWQVHHEQPQLVIMLSMLSTS